MKTVPEDLNMPTPFDLLYHLSLSHIKLYASPIHRTAGSHFQF